MNSHVQQIELELEEAKSRVADLEALERLQLNADFKRIFTQGYFKDEAARIVGLKADPNFVFAGKKQAKFLEILEYGVSALQQHFRLIRQKGESAREALDDMETTHQEVLAEDAIGSGQEVI